jgi:hypothetical protein
MALPSSEVQEGTRDERMAGPLTVTTVHVVGERDRMAGSAAALRIARGVTRTCSLPATRVNPDRGLVRHLSTT